MKMNNQGWLSDCGFLVRFLLDFPSTSVGTQSKLQGPPDLLLPDYISRLYFPPQWIALPSFKSPKGSSAEQLEGKGIPVLPFSQGKLF